MDVLSDAAVKTKKNYLEKTIAELNSVLIAYSGGVDSSLLSYYGRLLLGSRATVVIAVSPSLANDELVFARKQSHKFNWDLVEIETDEVEQSDYQRNDRMRCYFCKSTLFEAMHKLACQRGVKHLAYGANIEDLSDFRPGALAASQYRVLSPLQDANLTKEEIRYLAKVAGLPSWDRPQSACLSSRFPTYIPITIERLSQVDQAETFLRKQGFRQVRVRYHNDLASIEVAASEVSRLLDDRFLAIISEKFKLLGFNSVSVDLAGYRQGSANVLRD